MEESSSEEENELDFEKLDPQSFVRDEEDQKYLDSLPEVRREAILNERFEELKNKEDMKKALREAKRKEREEKKLENQQPTPRVAAKKSKAAPKKAATQKEDKPQESATEAAPAPPPAEEESPEPAPRPAAKVCVVVLVFVLIVRAGRLFSAGHVPSQQHQSRQPHSSMSFLSTQYFVVVFASVNESLNRQSASASKKDDDDDDLDFGNVDDDDSDYEESFVPQWRKQSTAKSTAPSQTMDSRFDDDEDYGNDDDDEGDGERFQSRDGDIEATVEDYAKITIPRRRLARWCNEPFFKDAVMNCFVRLSVGEHQGKKMYRFCKIVGVSKGKKEYRFPPSNPREKPVSANNTYC